LIWAKAVDSIGLWGFGGFAMLGTQKVHARLFYEFDLETHVPADHLLGGIDSFLDLNDLHEEMRSFYSNTGCPSIEPRRFCRKLLLG
jgi:transposase